MYTLPTPLPVTCFLNNSTRNESTCRDIRRRASPGGAGRGRRVAEGRRGPCQAGGPRGGGPGPEVHPPGGVECHQPAEAGWCGARTGCLNQALAGDEAPPGEGQAGESQGAAATAEAAAAMATLEEHRRAARQMRAAARRGVQASTISLCEALTRDCDRLAHLCHAVSREPEGHYWVEVLCRRAPRRGGVRPPLLPARVELSPISTGTPRP